MSFGVYVHIPYCLQRCPYCDFSTYEWTETIPPDQYVARLLKEIRWRSKYLEGRPLDTIYFGGGTPSLIEAHYIVTIIEEIEKCGFQLKSDSEVTLEINPATLDPAKIETYLKGGVNRFSVGAQTFDEGLLKVCGRKHDRQDTIDTLQLLQNFDLNYSLDILFALPQQSESQLRLDLITATQLNPSHISAYCLTLPENHPMQKGRPPEDEQIAMFHSLNKTLRENGFERYEISNFAKPGKASKHNLLYWQDQDFLGFGLSAHSYLRQPDFGFRFWNAASMAEYCRQMDELEESKTLFPLGHYPSSQIEKIAENQSLTDFCHTSLRLTEGLRAQELQNKFSSRSCSAAKKILTNLSGGPWVEETSLGWKLSESGLLASNQVFQELTFLPDDLS